MTREEVDQVCQKISEHVLKGASVEVGKELAPRVCKCGETLPKTEFVIKVKCNSHKSRLKLIERFGHTVDNVKVKYLVSNE